MQRLNSLHYSTQVYVNIFSDICQYMLKYMLMYQGFIEALTDLHLLEVKTQF